MDRELYEAAASGDVNFLHGITDDFDQVTLQRNTVLHIAVNFNQLEFSSHVLKSCPSLLLKANIKGESPLHVAAKTGCLEIAELLVKSARTVQEDVESRVVDIQIKELFRMVNHEKDTALHVAVKFGQFGVAKLLMEAELGLLDLVNNVNASPLFLAVEGGFSNIANCILETSLAAHFGGPKGLTALHSAVIRGHKDIIKIIMEKRPDMIKEADIIGWTPLHYAAFKGDLEASKLFLECHSSTAYVLDKKGTSPLHVAAFEGHINVMNELFRCFPDISESVDKKGRNVLHAAIIGEQYKVVKYILKMPKLASIINEQDEEGNSALHLAVVYNNHNIISLLARDKRVVKTTMNNELSTAYDIFCSETKEKPFTAAKVQYLLQNTLGLPYWQQWVETKVKKSFNRVAADEGNSTSSSAEETPNGKIKSAFDVNLLVATLIATVTFTAAFTMPGGYKNDGPDQGTATLASQTAFKAFVIFDTVAFFFAVAMVVVHVITSLRHNYGHAKYKNLVLLLLWYALDGLVLAFASGMYVVLASKSIVLGVMGYVMAGCAFVVCDLFLFVNAVGHPFLGFSRLTNFLRNLLFRFGII